MKTLLLTIIVLFITKIGFSQKKEDTLFIKKNIYILSHKNATKTQFLKNDSSDSYVPVYKYNDKYYLYLPCDRIEHTQITIKKDSVFIFSGEVIKYKIHEIYKKNKVTIYNLKNKVNESIQMKVRTISKKRGFKAIKFDSYQLEKSDYYFLVVSTSKAKKIPIIVNDCKDARVKELEFQKINFNVFF